MLTKRRVGRVTVCVREPRGLHLSPSLDNSGSTSKVLASKQKELSDNLLTRTISYDRKDTLHRLANSKEFKYNPFQSFNGTLICEPLFRGVIYFTSIPGYIFPILLVLPDRDGEKCRRECGLVHKSIMFLYIPTPIRLQTSSVFPLLKDWGTPGSSGQSKKRQ